MLHWPRARAPPPFGQALPPVEHFCWEMARVPRLRSMLDAMRLRQSLPATLQRASDALVAVATAAREVM